MKKKIIVLIIILVWPAIGFSFELRGFGDVNFEKVVGSSKDKEYKNGSFVVGDVDLYISEQIDDRLDILSEILIEHKNGEADVERFQIGYTFGDYLRIRAGRFHTPYGFWNISFHHGRQLQPTIDRPEILKFESEGGILPVHTVGLNMLGRLKTASSIFQYDFMIGNGDKIVEKDGQGGALSPNVTSDDNNSKSVAVNLTIKPGSLPGLKLSMSGSRQRIQSERQGYPVDTDQVILVPSFLYNQDSFEIWGEYFYIQNKDKLDNKKYKSNGYYLLLTYSIKDQWIPYILYETRNIDDNDKYFTALGNPADIKETIVGIRYNISYRNCIKVEGRVTREGNDNYSEYATQWAISF